VRDEEATPGAGWEGADVAAWARRLGVPELELHATLGSSNDRLRDLARADAPPFTTVVAGTQTAGRGREGRFWRSEPGAGLWVSVLLPPPPGGPPGVAPLAVGVAVARTLESLGIPGVGLKWPNDVLVEGKKIAGILCEVAHGSGGKPTGILAGIGVNLHAPGAVEADGGLPPTWIAREHGGGTVPGLSELARVLLRELRRAGDPSPDRLGGELRALWEARDVLFGRRVYVEPGGGRVVTGRAAGVSPTGALLLRPDGGTGDAGAAPVLEIRAGRVRLESLPGAAVPPVTPGAGEG
jgi:BirA family transcriptional regulator, biotin operon repressor / biotin---[acetyl-CoA-carboxylase] ligase